MRISWGTRSQTLNLGPYETRRCDACQCDRAFSVVLRYSYQYVMDPALSMVSEKQYAIACDVCGRGSLLDTRIMEKNLKKNPIPWQHRYGFVIGALAIAVVALLIGWLNYTST